MGIERFIQRVCVQTAVYWGNPVKDGYGGFTFDNPVEIDCRWEDKTEVKSDGKGNEIISRAVVLITQDLDEQGYLYLGTLNNLDSDQLIDPIRIPTAFMIKLVEKVPMIRSTAVFVRTVYL